MQKFPVNVIVMIPIILFYFAASTQAYADAFLAGVQYANQDGLTTLTVNTEEKSSNRYAWGIKAGYISNTWEQLHNNGTRLEQEDTSGLYYAIEMHKYFLKNRIYSGFGFGMAIVDWTYTDSSAATSTVLSQREGTSTISEAHMMLGLKLNIVGDLMIEPSFLFGTFLGAQTSGVNTLGNFFLPSLAVHYAF